ncbi:MAG: hypothetical protein M0Z45_02530 [Actinomycetota bacterium]|nr:hypothetical protein [Actinomycetota bacterium]
MSPIVRSRKTKVSNVILRSGRFKTKDPSEKIVGGVFGFNALVGAIAYALVTQIQRAKLSTPSPSTMAFTPLKSNGAGAATLRMQIYRY